MRKDAKFDYGDFKNANRYGHKAVVVLKFEEVQIEGRTQIYATGFDLDKPGQQVSIALMQEDGYRKNIAQVNYGITEKVSGNEVKYFNTNTGKEIPKNEYNDLLKNNVNVEQDFNKLVRQRSNAEGLLAKRLRIASLPAVLMFDNANKLNEVGGIEVYEARWVSGLSGNTNSVDADKEVERDFTVSHRKVLANIRIKYDENDRPVWGDCNAVDRVIDLKAPNPTNTQELNAELKLRNRDILRYALSNVIKSGNYEVERKPFTYFNLVDPKDKTNVQTVSILTEEKMDSRHKTDDPIVKFHFKRPEDAAVTLNAYLHFQDAKTKPLLDLLTSGSTLTGLNKKDINDAYAADKARAVICSLLSLKFNPIITNELTERANDKDLAADLSIKANDLKSIHKKLCLGELEPRMINGTTYPLGPKYLQRFVQEVQITDAGNLRPMRGLVNMQPFEEREGVRPKGEKILPYQDNKLIFSEMYICPKKWETTSDRPSVFTGLITSPAQSLKEVMSRRVMHSDLQEFHSPSASSYRFLANEYKDYINGTLEIPSVGKAIAEERERVMELSKVQDATVEYDNFYRLMGIHKAPEQPKQAEPQAATSVAKEHNSEMDLSS